MMNTIYSHAFLVGNLNSKMIQKDLSPNCKWKNLLSHWKKEDGNPTDSPKVQKWDKECISANGGKYNGDEGYNGLCTVFYKAHVDAMVKGEGQGKLPKFLKDVCHYTYDVNKSVSIYWIRDGKDKDNKPIQTLSGLDKYKLVVLRLHLYFFPLGIKFFAIEIDDTGSDLNDLTMGHYLLSTWKWEGNERFTDETKKDLELALKPLKEFISNKDLGCLLENGNKMKIFQTIEIDSFMNKDSTLFEIGTSSAIGSVGGTRWFTPSDDYYNKIINENTVSAFKSWKGLALMDSFTILGVEGGINKEAFNYMYFPLIYLRCLFEKSFCTTRNNAYREDRGKGNLSQEISQMEKYYFYENISYNFLPNLLYKNIAKGLDIKDERDNLTKQIKEKATRNHTLFLGMISVFAIFSVTFDLYSLIKAWAEDITIFPSEEHCFDVYPALIHRSVDRGQLPLLALILFIIALISSYFCIRYLKSRKI